MVLNDLVPLTDQETLVEIDFVLPADRPSFKVTSKLVISVTINRLVVPELVHLGEPTLLDCDYSVNGDEGLVLKWYLNEKLVYQWIPSTNPHALGILRGRVNLNYSASTDTNSVHRAIHIIQPGPDLSGDYTCLVSSYTSEDRQTKRMLVFAPGKNLELKQQPQENGQMKIICSAKDVVPQPSMTDAAPGKNLELKQQSQGNGQMKIICSAKGVFPQPSMNLHVNNSEVENSVLSIIKKADLYDVEIMAELPQLTYPEEFKCELHIPQANYTVRKETICYPGKKT